MTNDKNILYIAALLHDIGKFFQRTDDHGVSRSLLLSADTKKAESIFCPNYNNYYTHKHVLWTYQFIIENANIFQKAAIQEAQLLTMASLAAAHHKPNANDELQLILQTADLLASGGERVANEGNQETDTFTHSWDNFKKECMCSVFERLNLWDNTKFQYQYKIPIRELTVDDNFFPSKNISDTQLQDYKQLWKHFTDDFQKLNIQHTEDFAETLLALLQKYTVTIPSSTNDLRDVSLFDHSKVVAALAICLYDYCHDQKIQVAKLTNDTEPFLLIGADISGIQSFIYQITSAKASKSLKGRSFYLQLLTESIMLRLLKELRLYAANAIYASGGNFFIIAPNTEKTKNIITDIEKTITDELFDEHKTNLALLLAYIPVSVADIKDKKLNQKWHQLHTVHLDAKKRQKLKFQVIEKFAEIFEPCEIGGLQEQDAVTGEEITQHEKKIKFEDGFVSPITDLQIRLGKQLRDFDYLVRTTQQATFDADKTFYINGYYYYFIPKDFPNLHRFPKDATFINCKDVAFEFHAAPMRFDFYGGNDFPTIYANEEKGQKRFFELPKTFSEMAGMQEEERSYQDTFPEFAFKRLGVLRMDVDNLGSIFKNGFNTAPNQSVATFSRYASLSRSLDYFFKGYLNFIWQTQSFQDVNNVNYPFKDWTQIIYAGGDDLFIVGKWNVLIHFAKMIQQKFSQWTAHNPKLGISGGIALVTPKFPIAKAADIAGEAENLAKNHNISSLNIQKNAFTLLNIPLHWQDELPIVEQLKNKFLEIFIQEKLPKAILMKIQAYYDFKKDEERKQGKSYNWQWKIAYEFARTKERYSKSPSIKDFLDQLKTDLIANTYQGRTFQSDYHFFDLLNLAARWAEFELRELILNKNWF